MRQQLPLYAILAAYLVLATLYSLVTPLFEASDELWHYPMVKTLADNGLSLPVQNPAVQTPWRQEGSQPPLYYMLAAVLTSGIDTSDMDVVRRINPHADIGLVRPDGNVNMIVHRDPTFPPTGTRLAVYVARFFSVLLGLGTVIVTYLLARQLFPTRPTVILGATALNASLPMFLFISGSVNNDNLSNLLGNLLTLLIVLVLKQPIPPQLRLPKGDGVGVSASDLRLYIALGVVTGAGLLAKLNIGFLVPLVALALLISSVRRRDWRPVVIGGAISGGLTILIAGWWYLRNGTLYGDPTGLNVFLDIVGRRAIPANAAQLWAERHSFTQAFWGFFGGVNVPLPDWMYLIFNAVGMVGIAGVIGFIVVKTLAPLSLRERVRAVSLPHLLTLAWIIITFVSYLRWTAETPASQGRLIFGALSSICMWLALGLTWWLPVRLRPAVLGGVVAYVALVAVLAPFTVIQPAYAKPQPLQAGEAELVFSAPEDGAFGLVGARVSSERVQPEGYVELELDWQIERPAPRDWSLFVHLLTPGDALDERVIISQRDVYPGQGTMATSDLPEGFAWRNPLAIVVPTAAYAPMTLDVAVGWYHLPTGERMTTGGGEEKVIVGSVELVPRGSALNVPNPLSINFDNQIELVGYSLSDLTPNAGESVDLTLYWRALRLVERDYVVFGHIINPVTLHIYAGSDAQPVGWTRPTSTWSAGEIIEDRHTLVVNPETPPGIYELEIGLYLQEPDGSFPRLRVVTADGGMANDYAYLTRVRALPVP